MTDRRTDHARRKRVAEMTPEEMRQELLVDHKTGLPNRRAFDDGDETPFVAMCDVNGLKAFNDEFCYAAGDTLIKALAQILSELGLDAYHNQGDEFLCKGPTFQELNRTLARAQVRLRNQPIVFCVEGDRVITKTGADFSFGIGTNLKEAERSLKNQKEILKASKDKTAG